MSLNDAIGIFENVVKVISFMETVRHARKERQELHKEVLGLLSVLEETERTWGKFGPVQQQKIQEEIARQDLTQRTSKLLKQLDWVSRPWSGKNLLIYFKWPYQKEDVIAALERIHRLNQRLTQLTALKTAGDVAELAVGDKIKHCTIGTARLVQEFIRTYTPAISFDVSLEPASLGDITKGTGEWFSKESAFQNWVNSDNGLLFVSGIRVWKIWTGFHYRQRDEETSRGPPTFQVARVFCDYQIQGIHDLRDPMDIIMSLWAQLVASLPDLELDLEYINMILSERETFLSPTENRERKLDIFEKTTTKIGAVVLIVDGLDEVPQRHQREVVARLREIQQRSKRCRLLITSRPYHTIMGLFYHDSPQSKFHLEAKQIDLRLYIADRFSRNALRGMKFRKQEEITCTLVEKCNGSFLLARLFMDEVLRANTDEECSDIISGLPESASEAYDRGMNRLANSSRLQAGLPCIAIQALFWVAYAKAPMTEPQLRQTLAINQRDDDYNPSRKIWDDRGIDELCGKLLLVDHRNDEVRAAHQSIIDHLLLENTRKTWFSNIREHIPSVLLHFLLFKSLRTGYGGGSMDNFRQDFPLCQYALQHWGVGLNAILKKDTSIWTLAERFLKARFHDWNEHVKELMVNCLTSKCRTEVWKMAEDAVTPGQVTGMHWAVFFDLRAFVPILSHHEEEFPVNDPIPTTPLGLAAAYSPESRQDMARILLENGAKVNLSQCGPQVPRQPLHDAVYYCNVEVAELLLDAGADRTLRLVENDESAIDLAYILCRTGGAKLIASRISGNAVTAQEVQFLVQGGFSADLQRVIKEGLDVNQPSGNGKQALDYVLEAENERLSECKEILVRAQAGTKLTWPPVLIGTCPYPVNFLENPTNPPLDVMEKSWSENDCAQIHDGDPVPFLLLLEKAVPSHVKTPVRSIVFETVSRDQGWSSWDKEFHGTYIGSTTIQVSVKQPGGLSSPSFVIQRNLCADSRKHFKLHTNIWNLSELKTSSPRKAELVESLQPGSILRVSAHVRGGPGWANYVSFVRARLYEVEF